MFSRAKDSNQPPPAAAAVRGALISSQGWCDNGTAASFAKVLSAGNRELLRVIAEKAPGSLDEVARITGKAKTNPSRTLRTMEGYGLVRLERGERGRITPKVMHDRVELNLLLTLSRKAS
jgi:predicted transcriptional regulator